MRYIGIETQQKRNNIKSIILLISFPCLMLLLLYIGCSYYVRITLYAAGNYIGVENSQTISAIRELFISVMPVVLGVVFLWFIIAYYTNVKILDYATGARTLERTENKKIYNLVENLCITCGMEMPRIHIVDDDALNAFASGVSGSSYTITLTRGLINSLDDKELEGVIAHELTHICNNDVRVLIISIVFVGIFSLISQIAFRIFFLGGSGRGSKKGVGRLIVVMFIVFLLAIVGYFVSIILRFAISRKREYMADAGAAALTKDPLALASALRKISGHSCLTKKHEETVAQLFIEHDPDTKSFLNSIFATHPNIWKRIMILEQF